IRLEEQRLKSILGLFVSDDLRYRRNLAGRQPVRSQLQDLVESLSGLGTNMPAPVVKAYPHVRVLFRVKRPVRAGTDVTLLSPLLNPAYRQNHAPDLPVVADSNLSCNRCLCLSCLHRLKRKRGSILVIEFSQPVLQGSHIQSSPLCRIQRITSRALPSSRPPPILYPAASTRSAFRPAAWHR